MANYLTSSAKYVCDNIPLYRDGSKYLLVLHHLTYSIPLLQQFVYHFTQLKLKINIKVIFRGWCPQCQALYHHCSSTAKNGNLPK